MVGASQKKRITISLADIDKLIAYFKKRTKSKRLKLLEAIRSHYPDQADPQAINKIETDLLLEKIYPEYAKLKPEQKAIENKKFRRKFTSLKAATNDQCRSLYWSDDNPLRVGKLPLRIGIGKNNVFCFLKQTAEERVRDLELQMQLVKENLEDQGLDSKKIASIDDVQRLRHKLETERRKNKSLKKDDDITAFVTEIEQTSFLDQSLIKDQEIIAKLKEADLYSDDPTTTETTDLAEHKATGKNISHEQKKLLSQQLESLQNEYAKLEQLKEEIKNIQEEFHNFIQKTEENNQESTNNNTAQKIAAMLKKLLQNPDFIFNKETANKPNFEQAQAAEKQDFTSATEKLAEAENSHLLETEELDPASEETADLKAEDLKKTPQEAANKNEGTAETKELANESVQLANKEIPEQKQTSEDKLNANLDSLETKASEKEDASQKNASQFTEIIDDLKKAEDLKKQLQEAANKNEATAETKDLANESAQIANEEKQQMSEHLREIVSSVRDKVDSLMETVSNDDLGSGEGLSYISVKIPGQEVICTKLENYEPEGTHSQFVEEFFIDNHCITNKLFAEFVAQTNYRTIAERRGYGWVYSPQGWIHDPKNPKARMFLARTFKQIPDVSWKAPFANNLTYKELFDHPVLQVCYYDALAYTKWSQQNLPLLEQWEAASFPGGLKENYPWGKEANINKLNCQETPMQQTAPVGSYEKNLHDLHDICGNTWEICITHEDLLTKHIYLKGGSWHTKVKDSNLFKTIKASKYRYDNTISFRCIGVPKSKTKPPETQEN